MEGTPSRVMDRRTVALSEDDVFVRQELASAARKLAEARLTAEVVAEQSDSAQFDPDLWSELVKLGWLEACLDGAGPVVTAGLFEELGRALYPGPFFSTVALAGPCLGDDDRAEVMSGSSICTLAWRETDGMTSLADTEHLTTMAVESGGTWAITGTKRGVPDAGIAGAAVVVAATASGPGLFLVDLDGITVEAENGIDPSRRESTLRFQATPARLVRPIDETTGVLTSVQLNAQVAAAYEAIGVAERVLSEIVAYASTRVQFGKPIGAFQAVSAPLADAFVDIELARALAGWAALAVAEGDADADIACAAAKSEAAQAAIRTCERAIQASGAIGFSWEYLLHRYLRRAMWLDAFEGSATERRASIAKALIDDGRVPRTVELFDDDVAAAFRQEARAWIDQNLPTAARGSDLIASMEEYDAVRENWRVLMCRHGGLVAHWPSEHGGTGASDVITAIFREEAIRSHPRVSHGDCGVDLVAPLLMTYGTDDQKHRFLGPIRDEQEIWTQGFSEPNAGSDLASLSTRAVRDGDDWIMNGTKTWSTYAPVAQWIFVLARTDPEATRHRGISCFLVDATTPGIEIRPIRDIAGGIEFAEIFFTDVRVPQANMLGGENQGWGVAVMTLAHERVIESYEDIGELGFVVDRLLDQMRASADVDALARDRLARIWTRFQAVRLVQYSCVLALQGSDAPPSESEIVKLVWSEVAQDAARLGLELFGQSPDAPGAQFWQWDYLNARSLTIYAGTSEIIRSVVAERVLGLPRSR